MTWSDVAAIVTAIGGLLSVGATAYIAVNQTNRADLREVLASQLADVHRSQIANLAIRQTTILISFVEGFMTYMEFGSNGLKNEDLLRAEYEIAAARVRTLQQYPGLEPLVFAELAELSTLMLLPNNFSSEQPPYIHYSLVEQVKKLKLHRDNLARWT